MKKVFDVLLIPAKWILIIGSLVYATWFAVETAGSINGSFMSVTTHLIVLVVGTAMLFSVPILVLIKKVDLAKIAFLILAGYWLISTTRSMFSYAEVYTQLNDGLAVTGGIFAFLTGLCLVGVIVLIVLEFALKNSLFRLIAFFSMFGVILFGLVTGILIFILYAKNSYSDWTYTASFLVENLLVPTIVCFGSLFFLGAPTTKKGE